MRKLWAVDGAMETLGPFALWCRNGEIMETLNKVMGKLWGAKWSEENGKWAPDDAMEN